MESFLEVTEYLMRASFFSRTEAVGERGRLTSGARKAPRDRGECEGLIR